MRNSSIIHKFKQDEYDLVLFYLSVPEYFKIDTYVINPENSFEAQSYQIVGINLWRDNFVGGIVGDVFFRKCDLKEAVNIREKE